MTTFAELRTLVNARTARPDLTALTDVAIRLAVMRAHHVDFFPRDQAEATIAYAIPTVLPFVDIPTLSQQSTVSRLRAPKSVFGLEVGTNALVEQLEFRETDDFYDSEGYMRISIYSLIGDTLRLVPASPTGLIRLNYYQNPNVAADTFSSWIADLYPDFIAAWAAQGVLTRIGFRELAARLDTEEVMPFKELLVASHMLGEVN